MSRPVTLPRCLLASTERARDELNPTQRGCSEASRGGMSVPSLKQLAAAAAARLDITGDTIQKDYHFPEWVADLVEQERKKRYQRQLFGKSAREIRIQRREARRYNEASGSESDSSDSGQSDDGVGSTGHASRRSSSAPTVDAAPASAVAALM